MEIHGCEKFETKYTVAKSLKRNPRLRKIQSKIHDCENSNKESTIAMFKIIVEANKALLHEELKCRPVLAQWQNVVDYCRMTIGQEPVERFIVFYLDKNMQLIRQELSTIGTNNQVQIYPREILKRALHLNATTIVLAHNHPSGNMTPSPDDIRMTKELRRVLAPNGIYLADHLIIGGNKKPYSIANRLSEEEETP